MSTPVIESSLSRLYAHNVAHDCAAITAFRKARDCGSGDRYTRQENRRRNISLQSKLVSAGYRVTPITGQYPEGGTTRREESFFVVDYTDSGRLLDDITRLGEAFEQDSVLFIPKGAIQNGPEKAFLIGTNYCSNSWLRFGKRELFHQGKLGYDSPIYTSYVDGRPFIFEDVGELVYIPGNGFGWWLVHRLAECQWELLDIDDKDQIVLR